MTPEVPVNLCDPPIAFVAVTPADGTDLPAPPAPLPATAPCRGLLLSAAGTVKVNDGIGATNTLPLQAGYNPGIFRRIWSTGTSGGLTIFALY